MTTGISLVRENTASMQPPRALWVTFPLGRPLGKPADPPFQLAVIRAALELLDRPSGPVLEDYPVDAPPGDPDQAPACPVSFAQDTDASSWKSRLLSELRELRPWYDLSLRRRKGRTLVGISDESPEENIAALGDHLDREETPRDVIWLKRAVEDLKALYAEAMTAQPGDYDMASIQRMFWDNTQLGAAILSLYRTFQNSDNDQLKLVARILAPREAVGAATGPQAGAADD